eukprot:CAMPEP_0198145692 /NCGR_PEP_ID=MMETSP1443-20131203/24847_1 /TAXON_ID=186043 /ORGANISM="Entomoneis sp., Strain CCMP2396" /LENGTH=119 /DNA_ID=CAMNT_0043809393 /DNA_START=42 /DNA_END=401 /DNA_ORIENTATION=+
MATMMNSLRLSSRFAKRPSLCLRWMSGEDSSSPSSPASSSTDTPPPSSSATDTSVGESSSSASSSSTVDTSDRIHSTDIAFKPSESGWGGSKKYSANFDQIFSSNKKSEELPKDPITEN